MDRKKNKALKYIEKLPKGEIHIHLIGLISKKTINKLSQKNGSGHLTEEQLTKLFTYSNLKEFIQSFLFILDLLKKPEDLNLVIDDLENYIEQQNISFMEIFFSPSKLIRKGLEINEMIMLIKKRFRKIYKEKKKKVRLLLDVSRNFGVKNAEFITETASKYKDEILIGIGLGGNEKNSDDSKYESIFSYAEKHNLHRVAHSGEESPPGFIWDTLKYLNVERIGHGITAAEDLHLMEYLKEKEIPLEICLSSNTSLKNIGDLQKHPLLKFFQFGNLITINSDDPTFFKTNLINEYNIAHKVFNLTSEEILKLHCNTIKSSFLSEEEKEDEIKKLFSVRDSLDNI